MTGHWRIKAWVPYGIPVTTADGRSGPGSSASGSQVYSLAQRICMYFLSARLQGSLLTREITPPVYGLARELTNQR